MDLLTPGLKEVLESGEFAVTAELGPPMGWDMEECEQKLDLLKDYADGINDHIDVQLAVSNNLVEWNRVGNRKPFIPIGNEGPWESSMVFATSSTPIRVKDELYFYYNAHRSKHYAEHGERYGVIGLAKLRLDGFVSMYSDGEGFLLTKPFTFEGDRLYVNADAGAGELKVQVIDAGQKPYEGYLSKPVSTDSVDHLLEWTDGRNIGDLQGKAVRLKFLMKDTHLYSFWID